jgi:hypothetical protein
MFGATQTSCRFGCGFETRRFAATSDWIAFEGERKRVLLALGLLTPQHSCYWTSRLTGWIFGKHEM